MGCGRPVGRKRLPQSQAQPRPLAPPFPQTQTTAVALVSQPGARCGAVGGTDGEAERGVRPRREPEQALPIHPPLWVGFRGSRPRGGSSPFSPCQEESPGLVQPLLQAAQISGCFRPGKLPAGAPPPPSRTTLALRPWSPHCQGLQAGSEAARELGASQGGGGMGDQAHVPSLKTVPVEVHSMSYWILGLPEAPPRAFSMPTAAQLSCSFLIPEGRPHSAVPVRF